MSKPPVSPADPEARASMAAGHEPATFVDAELDGLSFEGVDWSDRDARGLQLEEVLLRSVDLTAATLSRARLRDVVVLDGSWANVTATDASLSRVRFERVRLTGADLSGATLDNVTFVDCRLDLCSFRFSKLEIARFEACRMEESDFYNAQVGSTMFMGCDLSRAVLSEATFAGSEMRGCDLSAATDPQRLRGIRMPWSDVIRTAGELAAGIGIEVLDE